MSDPSPQAAPRATTSAGLVADLRAHPWLWVLRLLWLLLPVTVGGLIGDAVADTLRRTQVLVTVGAWIGWAGTLCALGLRRPATLTATRIVAAAPLAIAIAAAIASNVDPSSLVHGGSVLVLAFLPEVGNSLVDGVSYGDERRMLLRAPIPLLMGPIPLTWALVVVPVVAGPLLLSAGFWIPGIVVTLIALGAGRYGIPALHGLSRRWVIFVPNGFVLHDHLSTREPFLLRRSDVSSIGPAPAETDITDPDVVDVTMNAAGVVVLAEVRTPVEIVPIGRGVVEMRMVHRVAFCPTRPGELLRVARQRRVVG